VLLSVLVPLIAAPVAASSRTLLFRPMQQELSDTQSSVWAFLGILWVVIKFGKNTWLLGPVMIESGPFRRHRMFYSLSLELFVPFLWS